MRTLVVATRNRHKLEEIRAVLGPNYRCCSLSDFPECPPVVEDADTFAGNAAKKAVQLAVWLAARTSQDASGRWLVLADDSGLEVDRLGGQPGVHSARFAALDRRGEANSPDSANNAKLLQLLKEVPPEKRSARFRCVIAVVPVARPGASTRDQTLLFEGACEGTLLFGPRGRSGFGYDPLFQPVGYEQSFAELGEGVKNKISHRARALEKLRSWLQDQDQARP